MPKEPLPSSFETTITLNDETYALTCSIGIWGTPCNVQLVSQETGSKFDLDDFPHDTGKILDACYAEIERWR